MASPVTLSQINAIPDLISTDRNELWFATIPNVPDTPSTGSEGLRLKQTVITPPQTRIGQMRVPMFNFARAYRGHREIGNVFSAEFYEDMFGGTVRTFTEWINYVCDPETDDSPDQVEYSVNCELYVYDTMGSLAHKSVITNVWPFELTFPPTNRGTSEAALVQVQFSCDYFDPEGIASLTGG